MDNRSVYEIVVICGGIFESNSRDQNELQCRLGEGEVMLHQMFSWEVVEKQAECKGIT